MIIMCDDTALIHIEDSVKYIHDFRYIENLKLI